jgi:hypothetical protein
MSKSNHREAQIIAALKQLEGDEPPRMCTGVRNLEAHDLCLEGKIRWPGGQRGTGTEAATG